MVFAELQTSAKLLSSSHKGFVLNKSGKKAKFNHVLQLILQFYGSKFLQVHELKETWPSTKQAFACFYAIEIHVSYNTHRSPEYDDHQNTFRGVSRSSDVPRPVLTVDT